MARSRKVRSTTGDGCKVVLYVRVSTAEQSASGLGIEDQLAKLEALATYREWSDVEVIEDRGESGKSLDRPGITRALAMLASGEACALAVAKLDRLSRSVVDFGSVLALAAAEGWSLVIADLDIDTGTPNGKLVAHVLMSVAEWERDIIMARTRSAAVAKRARGERWGRRPASDAVKARVVELRRAGLTMAAVAEQLNAEGVPTVRGGPWGTSSVQSVIKSIGIDADLAALAVAS